MACARPCSVLAAVLGALTFQRVVRSMVTPSEWTEFTTIRSFFTSEGRFALSRIEDGRGHPHLARVYCACVSMMNKMYGSTSPPENATFDELVGVLGLTKHPPSLLKMEMLVLHSVGNVVGLSLKSPIPSHLGDYLRAADLSV